jgi:hypothetical protein
MAKPRIFVSSTYFDLKHIRSSLDLFIDGLGYESILSEKGDIAYSPDIPLDESCYREVENVDIFILIIGSRYGSEATTEEKKENRTFFERYESITKKEYETALSNDIPSYILVETNVYAEYKTYLRNKGSNEINYAHVESINIFKFIEEVLSKQRNNPIFTFERYAQIEEWLKSQWAGLFRELLRRKTQQTQLKSLTAEVTGLQEVNNTLKTYMEALMSRVSKTQTSKIIQSEEKRLKDLNLKKQVSKNRFYEYVYNLSGGKMKLDDFVNIQSKVKSYDEFISEITELIKDKASLDNLEHNLKKNSMAQEDFNEIRKILSLPLFGQNDNEENSVDSKKIPQKRFTKK